MFLFFLGYERLLPVVALDCLSSRMHSQQLRLVDWFGLRHHQLALDCMQQHQDNLSGRSSRYATYTLEY